MHPALTFLAVLPCEAITQAPLSPVAPTTRSLRKCRAGSSRTFHWPLPVSYSYIADQIWLAINWAGIWRKIIQWYTSQQWHAWLHNKQQEPAVLHVYRDLNWCYSMNDLRLVLNSRHLSGFICLFENEQGMVKDWFPVQVNSLVCVHALRCWPSEESSTQSAILEKNPVWLVCWGVILKVSNWM